MKRILLAMLAVTALPMAAYAFSVDDQSMSGSKAANFSDPDEASPVATVTTNRAGYQGGNGASDSTDPSSVRYDYDAASGNYLPHRQ